MGRRRKLADSSFFKVRSVEKGVVSLDLDGKTQPTLGGLHKALSEIRIGCVRGHSQASLGVLAEYFGVGHVTLPNASPVSRSDSKTATSGQAFSKSGGRDRPPIRKKPPTK